MLKTLVKASISIFLLGLLLRRNDLGAVWMRLSGPRPDMLALGAGFLILVFPVSALRWDIVLRAMGRALGFRKSLAIVIVGQFFNLVLPSTIGGDVARVMLARRAGVRAAGAISSVVIDRLFALFALIVLIVPALPFLAVRLPPGLVLGVGGVALFFGLAIGAALFLDRIPSRLRAWTFDRFSIEGRGIAFNPRVAWPALALSVAGQLTAVLSAWALAGSLGLPVDLFACLLIAPPSFLVSVLPVSIAGWGVREGAFVFGFGLVGIAGNDALSLAILYGIVNSIVSVPGLIVWLFMGADVKTPELDKTPAGSDAHDMIVRSLCPAGRLRDFDQERRTT